MAGFSIFTCFKDIAFSRTVNKYVILHIFIPTIPKIFFARAFGARERLYPSFMYVKVKLYFARPCVGSSFRWSLSRPDTFCKPAKHSTCMPPKTHNVQKFFARAYGAREPYEIFSQSQKKTPFDEHFRLSLSTHEAEVFLCSKHYLKLSFSPQEIEKTLYFAHSGEARPSSKVNMFVVHCTLNNQW